MSKRLATLRGILGWAFEPKQYTVPRTFCYFSPRYHRVIMVPKGFTCDGATCAPNLGTAWIVHDYLFATHKWADGSPVTWRQANRVLHDIMEHEQWPEWVCRAFRRGVKTRWSLKAWKKSA